MNTCPVYRRSGGLSYGATYSGPIGLIIDPTFNSRKYSSLPYASSLNGSCTNVCPVKINIHEQIYAWRKALVRDGETPFVKRAAMKAAGAIFARPALYRATIQGANTALAKLPRFVIYNGLNAWGKIAKRQVRQPKPSINGSRRTGGAAHEQPRRSSGFGSRQLAEAEAAIAERTAVRCDPPASLIEAFGKGLTRMGGRLLDPGPADDVLAPVRSLLQQSRLVCSATPEITTQYDFANVDNARALADVDHAVVRAASASPKPARCYSPTAISRSILSPILPNTLSCCSIQSGFLVNLHDAYARSEFRDDSYTVFHSGPSATAVSKAF